MLRDVGPPLFDEATIHRRLGEMAAQITSDYHGQALTVLAVMNGALLFAADLLRRVTLPLQLECLRAASYHGATESSGTVEFPDGFWPELRGRHVLVVDDILDTGLTLHALSRRIRHASPASVATCVLLRKSKPRTVEVEATYVGFEIQDQFVVGYGLDFRGHYRHLPFIATLRQEVLTTSR